MKLIQDNGNYVTIWIDDSHSFNVPYEFITEIQDAIDPLAYKSSTPVSSPTISFDDLIQGR